MNTMLFKSFMLGTMPAPSTAWPSDDLIAPMLILVLGMAMGICLICLLFVVYHVRSGTSGIRLAHKRSHRPSGLSTAGTGIFPSPTRWLAVRGCHLHALQTQLGLHNPIPCSWEEGLGSAHSSNVFLSPPINGWILVMGDSLPDPSIDVDRCFRLIQSLSRSFGCVQFFQAERVVHHHAWVLADGGQILRAYAWADGTHWNQGVMTRDEIELRMRCFDYFESVEPVPYNEMSPVAANTEKVVSLASRWSVDPSSVTPRMLRENMGITGRPGRSIAY